MPNDQLDELLNRLVSGTGENTSAELEQLRSAIFGTPESEKPSALADIAAALEAPENGEQDESGPCELQSAEDYLARVAAVDQPVPASLLRLVGAAPAARTTIQITNRGSRLAGIRRRSLLPWGSAIAATVLAGISGYVIHDFIVRNPSTPASAILPTDVADARAPQSADSTVANAGALPLQEPGSTANTPVPVLAVTPPTPLTSHAVQAGDYPPDSLALEEHGTAKVKYLVLKTGSVGQCQVEISSGYPNLDVAACAMVKRWLFKPASLSDGTPVDWWLDTAITYNLVDGAARSTSPQAPAVATEQSGTTPTRGLQSKNEALVKVINDMNAAARAQNWTLALEKAQEADAIKNDKPAALNAPIHAMIVTAAINAHDYAAALEQLDKEIASGEGNREEKLRQALGVAMMARDTEKAEQYFKGLLRSPPDAPPHAPTPPVATTSHAVTVDDYPPVSVRLGEQGKVGIKYLVKEDGTVSDCNVIMSSGKARLDDAACTMAKRRWKFKPAVQNGKAVSEFLTAEVIFELK